MRDSSSNFLDASAGDASSAHEVFALDVAFLRAVAKPGILWYISAMILRISVVCEELIRVKSRAGEAGDELEMKGRDNVCIGQLKFTEEKHLLKVNKIRIFESLAVAELAE
jgi:hypothetical protein